MGAKQFVVQEALLTILCLLSLLSLTPLTTVISGTFAGADMRTLFAPAFRCFFAPLLSVKKPVHSTATSTFSFFQGRSAGFFSEKILNALIDIKPGELTTYSELAEKIKSKAYRAVGGVLKNNPLPLIIPCHRVIKKDGSIGGFMGKMNKAWQTNLKKNLLEIEGILIPD